MFRTEFRFLRFGPGVVVLFENSVAEARMEAARKGSLLFVFHPSWARREMAMARFERLFLRPIPRGRFAPDPFVLHTMQSDGWRTH